MAEINLFGVLKISNVGKAAYCQLDARNCITICSDILRNTESYITVQRLSANRVDVEIQKLFLVLVAESAVQYGTYNIRGFCVYCVRLQIYDKNVSVFW